MSWATYDSTPTQGILTQPPVYQQQMKPAVQNKPENPAYSQQAKQQKLSHEERQDRTDRTDRTPSRWEDISEYEEINDWLFIFIGIIVTEFILLVLVRYFPEFFGKQLNVWYNRFKFSAVLTDVLILAIAIGISRYVYTEFIYPKHDWNPLYFTGTTLFVQILHDILFYIGVVQQVPKGSNAMIDVMKEYANGAGTRAIIGDSALMISSVGIAMIAKGMDLHAAVFLGILGLYGIPYILETRNDFSSLS
jgi:hypothetical protein